MLWGSSGNGGISAQFLDSSDGFILDQATSQVLTVQTSVVAQPDNCDSNGFANAADAAASAAGVVIADFCLRVYLLPPPYTQDASSCGFAGRGTLDCPCGGCRTWTLYADASDPDYYGGIITHEIGHHIGE